MNTYSFRNRMGTDEQAQAVGEMLENLEDNSDQGFVKAARKRNNPAHDLFEWNDAKAAAEARLIQARVIRRALDVEISNEKQEVVHVVAFVHKAENEGQYIVSTEASSEELGDAVQEFLKLINRLQRRFSGLKEARTVIDAIDETKRHLTRRRKKAARK